MKKGVKILVAVALSLVLLAGIGLTGCGGGEELGPLKAPSMSIYQYLKGVSSDLNKPLIQTMAGGGGEPGYIMGLAATVYPTFYYNTAARDATAAARFPNYWYIPTEADVGQPTKFAWLQGGDPTTVDKLIFGNMPAANQDVVNMVVTGFFNGLDTQLADALAPAETSAYGILLDSTSKANADAWATAIGAAGADYADEFFYYMLKPTVDTYGCAAIGLPSGCTPAMIGAVGKVRFTNGTAGAMYPTKAEEKAQAMYSESYKDLDAQKKAAVDGAVYAALPSIYANDAARTAARDGMAYYCATTLGLINPTHTTYAQAWRKPSLTRSTSALSPALTRRGTTSTLPQCRGLSSAGATRWLRPEN